MKIATRLALPLAAASIALAVGVPPAYAGPIYCQYRVVNAPSGLFIRATPQPDGHTVDKVSNGTTGLGSQATTNGFRTFHGGWAGAAYLQRIPGTLCGE